MPISVIPFKMPEPMEIPPHITQALRQMPGDEAMKKGMELLLEIDAAETMIYERIGAGGGLELGAVVSQNGGRAKRLEEILANEACYSSLPEEAGPSLAGSAFAQNSALLVMGPALGEEGLLSKGLQAFLQEGTPDGNVGFNYVLPLNGEDGRPLGALTLIRPAGSGPLNHEQPNITEGIRQLLAQILDG